jgi:hypothetical protein
MVVPSARIAITWSDSLICLISLRKLALPGKRVSDQHSEHTTLDYQTTIL